MSELSPARLAELAALIEERVGLCVRPEALPALRFAVAERFASADPPRADPDAYVDALRGAGGDDELRRLVPFVTVGKTAFFRDAKQFAALSALLPGLLARSRAEGRALSMWSAGCATGEEPWSIAIAAAEAGAAAGELELLATDVNPDAVARAEAAAYAPRALRGLPPELAARWFVEDGEVRRPAPALRALLAAARTHNLVSPEYPRPACGAWDVVFCRNVLIYFDRPTAQAVVGRLAAGLAPGGWLVLGAAESLFRLHDGLELVEIAGAFLYRRPGGAPA